MLKNIFYISGAIAFLLISYLILTSLQRNNILPLKISVTPTISLESATPTPINETHQEAFCTQDSQCSSGYQCQAYQSTYTSCDGVLAGCHPVQIIVKGYCKAKRDTSCKLTDDCVSGLVCHQNSGILSQKTCVEITNYKKCTGKNDTVSCGSGYHCVQNCGPIIVQGTDSDPGYSCIVNEQKEYTCPQ